MEHCRFRSKEWTVSRLVFKILLESPIFMMYEMTAYTTIFIVFFSSSQLVMLSFLNFILYRHIQHILTHTND
jgi:hypothetical protein